MKKLFSCLVICSMIFAGCAPNTAAISISGLNYSGKHISDFSVDGYSAGNISTSGGGGSFVCCVSIPLRWRPGLKATIRWADDEANPDAYKERVVDIPEYGPNDFGFFIVHFYPDNIVKILVTPITVTHPDYPYPRPKT